MMFASSSPSAPFALTTSWLGQTLLQHPAAFALYMCISRAQDPGALREAGRVLVVAGGEDRLVRGEVAAQALGLYLRDLELRTVEGGSRVLFVEMREKVVGDRVH